MKLQDFFPLIYCINLDGRPDRWEKAQEEFKKVGIENVQRFSAIKENPPWLGCYSSHLEILTEAELLQKNVLIFEDDVEFINFDKFDMESALDEMNKYYWWDMLYFGGNILKPFYKASNYWARLRHCQSTHAYGVNWKFIPRLRDWIYSNTPAILDVIYANTIVPNRNCFITIPSMLAIQRTDYSDIEGRAMSYDLPLKRYNKFYKSQK